MWSDGGEYSRETRSSSSRFGRCALRQHRSGLRPGGWL